jgi:Flp pilus assembly protein TadG
MMTEAKSRFKALTRDERGNVLPLAAMGVLLSAALVGGGIDMSRAYRVQNRLQSACDSAVLAGRRAVGSQGFDSFAETQADSYFRTNFNDSSLGTTQTFFTPSTEDNGQTIMGVARTKLNLAMMQIFGFERFELSVNCQASMGVGNSDVMMVLDTTGSMAYSLGSGTRISALQAAMKNFYTTVNNATAGTNARIRYGFVPFSSSVNVGRLLFDEDPSYIVDRHSIQSREQVKKWVTSSKTESEYKNDVSETPQPYAGPYNNKNSCENNLSNGDWENYGEVQTFPPNTITSNDNQVVTSTTTVQPMRRLYRTCLKDSSNNKWYRNYYYRTRDFYKYTTTTSNHVFDYWLYKEINYDVSAYKAFQSVSTNTGGSGSTVSSTWAGCIEERDTLSEPTFSFSTITGITPFTHDLDIDSAPTSEEETKWRPMWPQVAFRRNGIDASTTGYSVSSACPYRAQLLQAMSQGEFNSYADALYPEGSTYLDVGMTWGGRLLSPTGIFQDNVNIDPANGGEVSRHLIFMSDGDMDPAQTSQSAWGIEALDRRVTDNGSDSQDKSRHLSRFQALCAAIKSKGIRVWTISFTTGVSSALQTCASADSAFNADDATQLDAAFQEIAKQVGELRLTQ